MWQQKSIPEGLTEEALNVSWPETQHHLPQGATEVRTVLVCHHPLHVSPYDRRQGRVGGEPWLISGIFFHSDGILFVFSDGFYFLPLPSGAVSSAWTPSLHPVLKYIILPIQICQRLYYICISNLIKSFSGWHFFLEGNFKLNIFCLVISLSLSFQANFTFRLQITQYQERDHNPQLPSFLPQCAERLAFAFPTQDYPLRGSFPSILKYLYCPCLTVDRCFLPVASEWNSSCYAPEEGKAERYIPVCISGVLLSSMTLALGIFCNKWDRVRQHLLPEKSLCGRQWM